MIEHRFAEVLVTDSAVFFDGQELPWYISKDGISFEPGDDIGRLTVEFLVGDARFTLREPCSIDKWERFRRFVVLPEINAQHGEIDRIIKEYM